MTYKQYRPPLLFHVSHFPYALPLKLCITDCQHFIDDQDFRIQMGSNSKGKAYIHAAGITFNGGINKFLNFCKTHDLIKLALNLPAAHAQDCAVEINILAST